MHDQFSDPPHQDVRVCRPAKWRDPKCFDLLVSMQLEADPCPMAAPDYQLQRLEPALKHPTDGCFTAFLVVQQHVNHTFEALEGDEINNTIMFPQLRR